MGERKWTTSFSHPLWVWLCHDHAGTIHHIVVHWLLHYWTLTMSNWDGLIESIDPLICFFGSQISQNVEFNFIFFFAPILVLHSMFWPKFIDLASLIWTMNFFYRSNPSNQVSDFSHICTDLSHSLICHVDWRFAANSETIQKRPVWGMLD